MKSKLLCVFLATAFIGQSLTPLSAVQASENDDAVIISTVEQDDKITRTTELTPSANHDKLTYETDKNSASKVSDYKEILEDLGYEKNELETMGDKTIYNTLKDTSHITVTESYLKVDSNNNVIPMDKETCLDAVAEVSKELKASSNKLKATSKQLKAADNNAYYPKTSEDGYMKIMTQADYSVGKGEYIMSGNFTWLKIPFSRMKDAISVAAPDCAWLQNGTIYSNMTYKLKTPTGDKSYNKEGDVQVESTGLSCIYNLPNDIDYLDAKLKSLSFMIWGMCKVKNYTKPNAFNVFTKYEHVYSSVSYQPSFSWSATGISAEIAGAGVNDHTLYSSHVLIDYKPDIK